jgi:hypothetical protein
MSHFAAPHFSAPAMRSVPHFSSAPHFQSHMATSHIANSHITTSHVATAHTEALRALHTQQRVDHLEQRAQTGHLTGREQKQLNTLHEQQAHQQQLREQTTQKLQDQQKLHDQNAQKLQEGQKLKDTQRLQDQQKLREQNAQKLQEGQKLKDTQRLQDQQKLREQNAQKLQEQQKQREAADQRRKDAPRVTPKDAAEGRFAKDFQNRHDDRAEWSKDAWHHHNHAFFIAWVGPVFWPYVYSDIFYYTFWPYNFDYGYWPYLYDDFFETLFWPNGGPYADYYYSGPYTSELPCRLRGPAYG